MIRFQGHSPYESCKPGFGAEMLIGVVGELANSHVVALLDKWFIDIRTQERDCGS